MPLPFAQADDVSQENMPECITGSFDWDLQEIAAALRISGKDVRAYFTDGRRVSFLLERRIAYEVLNDSLAPSEGAGYDVLDEHGQKWQMIPYR